MPTSPRPRLLDGLLWRSALATAVALLVAATLFALVMLIATLGSL